jgi:hypothetical protein
MTALDHLRKLVAEEPAFGDGDGNKCCAYCVRFWERHATDCPWLAAKAFVEQWDETDRLNAPK